MNDFKEEDRKAQRVQESPGLWFYFPDLWYREKSGVYTWYEASKGIWRVLDGTSKEMSSYSTNGFCCENPQFGESYRDRLKNEEWKESLGTDIGITKVIKEDVRTDSNLNMKKNFQNPSKNDIQLLTKSFFLSVFISIIFSNIIRRIVRFIFK